MCQRITSTHKHSRGFLRCRCKFLWECSHRRMRSLKCTTSILWWCSTRCRGRATLKHNSSRFRHWHAETPTRRHRRTKVANQKRKCFLPKNRAKLFWVTRALSFPSTQAKKTSPKAFWERDPSEKSRMRSFPSIRSKDPEVKCSIREKVKLLLQPTHHWKICGQDNKTVILSIWTMIRWCSSPKWIPTGPLITFNHNLKWWRCRHRIVWPSLKSSVRSRWFQVKWRVLRHSRRS